VADVLAMTAFEVGAPVADFVFVKTCDVTIHRSLIFG